MGVFPVSFCLFKGEPCGVALSFGFDTFLVLLVVGFAVAFLSDSFFLVRHSFILAQILLLEGGCFRELGISL